MDNTTKRPHDTSLVEAASINGKLGASVVVSAAGFVAGSFIALADSASTHAKSNPDGIVSKALKTSLADQWSNAREKGYELIEDAKDVVDFSKVTNKDKGTDNETK